MLEDKQKKAVRISFVGIYGSRAWKLFIRGVKKELKPVEIVRIIGKAIITADSVRRWVLKFKNKL